MYLNKRKKMSKYRKKMSRRRSGKLFTKTAKRFKRKNMQMGTIMRGGYRL